MTRFTSLIHVPSETRRILRRRFSGCIPSDYTPTDPSASTNLRDEILLHLFMNLTIEFEGTANRARQTYSSKLSSTPTEPTFDELLELGWMKIIWGRIATSFEVADTARRSAPRPLTTYISLLEGRFSESYVWDPAVYQKNELRPVVRDITSGHRRLEDFGSQDPGWVAARLWDRTFDAAVQHDHALRVWFEKWKHMWFPSFVPRHAWNDQALTAFHDAVVGTLTDEIANYTFHDLRLDLVRQYALTTGCTLEVAQKHIPNEPHGFTNSCLWLDEPAIERFATATYVLYEDFANLLFLLEKDITEADHGPAPHPLASRLLKLASTSAPVFLILLFHARRNPYLVVEFLLHPPTSPLACMLIAGWQSPTSAWDRELIDRDNNTNKFTAFTDAVAILGDHLHAGLVSPTEVAGLVRWLRYSIQFCNEADQDIKDRLLSRLYSELANQSTAILVSITEILIDDRCKLSLGAPEFAAALDLIHCGQLIERIDAGPLVEGYVESVGAGRVSLSATDVSVEAATTLFALASNLPRKIYDAFLAPVDVRKRLEAWTQETQFTLSNDIGRSLRAHIRLLCRMVIGLADEAPPDLLVAVISAIRSGALAHTDKARVPALSPSFEVRHFSDRIDRPISADIGGAISTLKDAEGSQLLAAVLETDEPTILAQLLNYSPKRLHERIRARIADLTPAEAAPIYSLNEVQHRIDALLAAGLGEIAEAFIEEEKGLETLGEVPGRDATRFGQVLRAKIVMGDWVGIQSAQVPAGLRHAERQMATETLDFYQAVAALNSPEGDRKEAVRLFQRLHQSKPSTTAYAINLFLAQIRVLFDDNLFLVLGDQQLVTANKILMEGAENIAKVPTIRQQDIDVYNCYRGLLLLATGLPAEGHELLTSINSQAVQDTVGAFDAVALHRLGRGPESTAIIEQSIRAHGNTQVLIAATSYLAGGKSDFHIEGLAIDDETITGMVEAMARLKQVGPTQQARVLRPGTDALDVLLTDYIRGASTSVVSLVPAMKAVRLDTKEDDITALVRELLIGQLEFIGWTVSDHSREGFSSKGNSGKPDLLVRSGSTTLTVIEAVVCRDAIRHEDLRRHFQKLFGYTESGICFLLAYSYRAVSDVCDRLRSIAEGEAPTGFRCLEVTDLSRTGSQTRGFFARYSSQERPLKVVFLVLDLAQGSRRAAAAVAGQPN